MRNHEYFAAKESEESQKAVEPTEISQDEVSPEVEPTTAVTAEKSLLSLDPEEVLSAIERRLSALEKKGQV